MGPSPLLLAALLAVAEPRLDLHGDPLPEGARARLGTVRWRADQSIGVLRYLADGRELLNTSVDGMVCVWDTATGRVIRQFGVPQRKDHMTYTAGFPLVSPDGRWLAQFGALDRTFRVWDIASGTERWQQGGGAEAPYVIAKAFSPVSRRLAIEISSQTTAIVDAADGTEICRLPALGGSNRHHLVAFAPDGQLLASRGFDKAIRLYNPAGKLVHQLGPAVPTMWAIYSMTAPFFSGDGRTVGAVNLEPTQPPRSGVFDGAIHLWDVATGKEVRRIPAPEGGARGTGAVSGDGRTLAWLDADYNVRIYDLETGRQRHRLGEPPTTTPAGAVYLSFSPDGKRLLARDQRVRMWDLTTGRLLWTQELFTHQAEFAPDGRTVAVVASGGRVLQRWDAATGADVAGPAGHRQAPIALAVSADGGTISSLSLSEVHRWDAATGTPRSSLGDRSPTVALSADGSLAAVGLRDPAAGGLRTVQVHDLEADRTVCQLELPRATGLMMAFSPREPLLALRLTDSSLRLFDRTTGKEQPAPPELLGPGRYHLAPAPGPRLITFLPDGSALANFWRLTSDPQGGATPYFLNLTHIRTGRSVGRFVLGTDEYPGAVAAAPDGASLALVSSRRTNQPTGASVVNVVRIVEVATCRERLRWEVPRALAPAFSADGRVLAWGDAEGAIHGHDLWADRPLPRRAGHRGPISALTFSPDGRWLISGSEDTSVLVWDRAALGAVPVAAEAPDAAAFERLWATLQGVDPAAAFVAMRRLAAAPASAAFLRDRLQPVAPVAESELARLIAELNGDDFRTRQQAEQKLTELGERAAAALRQALAANPSLDARQRLERLLDRLQDPTSTANQLRPLRAVEVLAQLGTPPARDLLADLARGAPSARLTQAAAAALARK